MKFASHVDDELVYSVPYSGYFSGGKIFVSSKFGDSSWKRFRGRGMLNHTPCTRGVVMACYFEVEVMVRSYHQIWDAQFGILGAS